MKIPAGTNIRPGTVALKATDEELRRDGIDVSKLTVKGSG